MRETDIYIYIDGERERVTVVIRRRKGFGNDEELEEHGGGKENQRYRVGSERGRH